MVTERRSWMRRATATALAVMLSSAFTVGALAQERHRGDEDRHGPEARGDRHEERWDEHRDIRHFRDHDLRVWRGGHWIHDRHDGRFGWWWVVGGAWYFYPAPVYPYPNPYVPPVVVAAPPRPDASPQYWYFCRSSNAYYPYVTSCPEGWMQVAPQPVLQ